MFIQYAVCGVRCAVCDLLCSVCCILRYSSIVNTQHLSLSSSPSGPPRPPSIRVENGERGKAWVEGGLRGTARPACTLFHCFIQDTPHDTRH
jgi:hypothetical protein